jgi:hypothetical protein
MKKKVIDTVPDNAEMAQYNEEFVEAGTNFTFKLIKVSSENSII